VCSQSCVSGWRLPVLPMGGHNRAGPPIHVVPSPSTTVQAVLEVVVLKDRIDKNVDHLKWIEKLVCVHSYCSVYNTNEVDGNASVWSCI
jgi:hypothetical protein